MHRQEAELLLQQLGELMTSHDDAGPPAGEKREGLDVGPPEASCGGHGTPLGAARMVQGGRWGGPSAGRLIRATQAALALHPG